MVRARLVAALVLVTGGTLSRAATFTVVNTDASGAGSLAQAIANANVASDLDDIEFDVPGGGVPLITASLPAITQPVAIDGTTQPGGFVELRNPGGTALSITGSGSTVRGMVINSSGTGVSLGPTGGGNIVTGCRIGTNAAGTAAAANLAGVFVQSPSSDNVIADNLISGNTQNGISIQGHETIVTGNVIGLDVTGTQAVGGGTGITVSAGTGNRIGGTQAGEGNVIAGGTGNGLSIVNASTAGTVIQGNRIGTNAAGAAGLGPSIGVSFASVTGAGTVLGGAEPGAGNLIVGASSIGVVVLNSSNVTIQGNTIGTAALPNASHGVDLVGADGNALEDNVLGGNGQAGINVRSGADGNTIRGNEISGNGGIGIAISGGQMDRLTENAIHDNGGLGIDLGVNGVTANYPLDADVAPGLNDGQNYPVLSAVSSSEVTGTLHSTAGTAFTVEFFASPSCDGTGNGEGGTYLGAVAVMTDASGDAGDFAFPLPAAAAGHVITATAPDGDTSEFSACTGPVPGGTTTTSVPPSTTSSSSSTSTSSTTSTSTSSTSSSTPPTTATSSTTNTSLGTSSTTSTSTTSSSASSAASTTTPTTSTTTTTLDASCATEPVEASFRSLNCRLAALIAEVAAASELGSVQARLQLRLESAKDSKESAELACTEANIRGARQSLKRAVRRMAQVVRTLRSRKAKRAIEDALRQGLLDESDGVRRDLRTLKRDVTCPAFGASTASSGSARSMALRATSSPGRAMLHGRRQPGRMS